MCTRLLHISDGRDVEGERRHALFLATSIIRTGRKAGHLVYPEVQAGDLQVTGMQNEQVARQPAVAMSLEGSHLIQGSLSICTAAPALLLLPTPTCPAYRPWSCGLQSCSPGVQLSASPCGSRAKELRTVADTWKTSCRVGIQ